MGRLVPLERADADLKEAKQRVESNAAAGRAWQAKLQAERDAKQAEHDARIEAELQPIKERERRQWLIDHPDKDEKTFEARVWPLIKANLIEDRQKMMVQMATERLRRTGRYDPL